MPMIDVYAAKGTFPDSHTLARDLAAAVMRWEQVPDLPLFANNTAAFHHDMDEAAISNVAGDSNYVRVQVRTQTPTSRPPLALRSQVSELRSPLPITATGLLRTEPSTSAASVFGGLHDT